MKLALPLACLLASVPLAQKTIHVPGDAPSIQIAVAIADDGDTVLVAPGWYQERIDLLGRAITVRSEQGPEATRIDATGLPTWQPWIADGWGRVVRCISGEGLDTVLDGFTITGSDPCNALGAAHAYGGIQCEFITIRNCNIADNTSLTGGGVYGSPVMEDCLIADNIASDAGGGIYGSPTMINCTVTGNRSGGGPCGSDGYLGGGIYAVSDACLLVGCTISENWAGAGYSGGGVYGPAKLMHCLVNNNKVQDWIGGFPQGAGVFGAKQVYACTIVGNATTPFTPGDGGGVANCTDVTNCIIWDNYPNQADADSTVRYSSVEGGVPGIGNIDDVPLFVNETAKDYRLLPNSPCIDSGDPLSVPDADGTRADMGAFPFNHYPTCVGTKVPVAATIAFDHVGAVVAAGGSYVIAGTPDVNGPGFESGAAFLAYRDGAAWVGLPKLVASDEAPNALFGASVALDAGVAWIGAPGVSSEIGAAYAFRQQEDGAWAEEIKLMASDGTPASRFGSRVVVQGAVAAASAPLANAPGSDSGAVYVFKDGTSGWAEIAKLTALDGAAGDHFGSGLASSGSRLLIGAEGDASGAGSAYVFEDAGFGWGQQAKLVASDASANEQFGHAVGLDGDMAVITAPAADGLGAAYVFKRSGFVWSQQQKLVASSPFQNAEFGSSVAIAGSRIVVGARSDDGAASNAGAAFLYEFNGSTWVQTQKYTLPGTQTGDAAGSGVALSGDYVLVGAEWADDPELDSGELWAFAAPGTCSPKLTTVPGAQAQDPDHVTAIGTYLGQIQQVTIGGTPAPVISATDTTLTYQPQPNDPGFLPLTASGPEGTGQAQQQLYPSLGASTTGVGGTLKVNLDNGIGGLYVFAMGFQALPAPISIVNPPSWYGVLLNPASPLFVISQGAFATSAPIALTYNVPSDPLLVGFHLYLQAWCQQGFFGPEVTYSFTNMGAVTL